MTAEQTALPALWHFRVSHYNEKARWALDRKCIRHRRYDQVPGFHLPVVRWVSGQNQVPVLRLEGRVIAGSDRILEALEMYRPDPPLFPRDPALLKMARDIEAHYDQVVAPDVRRIFWATYLPDAVGCARMATDGSGPWVRRAWRWTFPLLRPLFRSNMGIIREPQEAVLQRVTGYLDALAGQVGPSGYLVGDSFTVADLTAAAVMTAVIRPPEFPYPLPEPWPDALRELRQAIDPHPGCQWVLRMYREQRNPSQAC